MIQKKRNLIKKKYNKVTTHYFNKVVKSSNFKNKRWQNFMKKFIKIYNNIYIYRNVRFNLRYINNLHKNKKTKKLQWRINHIRFIGNYINNKNLLNLNTFLFFNHLTKISYNENFFKKWYEYIDKHAFKETNSRRWKIFVKKWKTKHISLKLFKSFLFFLGMKRFLPYRKLFKNHLLLKVFCRYFEYIEYIKRKELQIMWRSFKQSKINNYTKNGWSASKKFMTSFRLKYDNLAILLGITPNKVTGREFIKLGGFRLNNKIIINHNYWWNLQEIIQIDLNVLIKIQPLYTDVLWDNTKLRINFLPFIETIWELMIFKMIRLPYAHELFEESILTERWLRYIVRYFPNKPKKLNFIKY